MGLTDTVFGTPPKTTLVQTPGTRDPGFGFAKDFFNFLPSLMNQAYPGYQGQIDPGMSPTMQDAIRRAQGYAQSGPSEILQGAQGSLGRFMSPSFQNPWNTMFGGAPNYSGVDPGQRIFGGGQAGATAFQSGMPGMGQAVGQPMQGPGGQPGMPGAAPGGMPSSFPNALAQAMNRQASPFGDPAGGSDAMLAALQGQGGVPPMRGPMVPPVFGTPAPGTPDGRVSQPGNGQPQLPPLSPTMGGGPGGPGAPGASPIPGGPIPPRPAWGSGGNARQGFLDFMGGIGKDFRQKTPMDYINDQMQRNPTSDPRLPQGSAGTDWRSYWKSLGRPGAPGAGPGGGPGPRPNPRGPTDRPVARPIPRPGQPTDIGVAKPMPKKKPPPVEILRAFG